jgi:dihydrofolate synthase / folylpolyglutamate synthase
MAQKEMIKTYLEAISYLKNAIPLKKDRFPKDLGLDRQKKILHLLGNPQNKIKSIHIAGTSGKGSTAFYISSLLSSQGFDVGLTISPHLLDIRERIQINNQLISKKEFIFYLNKIIPIIEKIDKSKFGQPTFFEIIIALAFYIFYQKKVDYIVIETGLGGLFDGTNTIDSPQKIAVITKIGIDHTAILGSTLSAIAVQKAGIIHLQNFVISSSQRPVVKKILDQTAQKNQTIIDYLLPKINFKNIKLQNQNITYDFSFNKLNISNIILNTISSYQVENTSLSLAVLEFLSQRDCFNININKVKQVFLKAKFIGRGDLKKIGEKTIILDGAHNPQKMTAFIKDIKDVFPHQKFIFLISFKEDKNFSKMIKTIIPLAQKIIFTQFVSHLQDMTQISQSPLKIVKFFQKIKFDKYQIIDNQFIALKTAFQSGDNIIITGSLYLLSDIYPLLKKNQLSN